MKNLLLLLSSTAAVMLMGSTPASAQSDVAARPGPARPPQVLPIAALMDSLVAAGFSGAIVTGNTQGATFARAAGIADPATRRPLTLADSWPLASVTKQLTAILIMQEVDRGRIALDQPLSRYLPPLAGASTGNPTIRQLLLHVSGLPNPDDSAAAPGQAPPFYRETGPAIGDMARARGYCAGAPKRAPGAAFEYNNCDYLVLGAVLEQLTGQPYGDLLHSRFARPLGLASLRVLTDADARAPVAVRGLEASGTSAPPDNFATLGAAGAAAATAGDLFLFDQALLKGVLLSQQANAEMTRGNPAAGYAALGVWSFPAQLRGCDSAVELVERRGDFAGIQTRNLLAPQLGKALVVLTNQPDFAFGELWQGSGAGFELASAAFCAPATGQ